jgi:hypothetical protein
MGIFGPSVGHGPLFEEVCKFHEIDKKIKLVLQAIVKKYQPPRPAEMFIEPDLLRRAMDDAEFADAKRDIQKLHDAWFLE